MYRYDQFLNGMILLNFMTEIKFKAIEFLTEFFFAISIL